MSARHPTLTPDLIAAAFPAPVSDQPLNIRVRTDAELADSLAETVPAAAPEAWVFGYGSLMWNPELDYAERRVADVRGWHRRFCLWQWRYRATRDRPGMMLALRPGGACRGLAYRIAGPDVHGKLAAVWRREMTTFGYLARWVTCGSDTGPIRALAFVANPASERYVGRVPEPIAADHIAGACGHIGPGAVYLYETVASCLEHGIHDGHLWRMQALVAERLERAIATASRA